MARRAPFFLLAAVVAVLLPTSAGAAEGTTRVLARLDGPLDVVLDDLADAGVDPESFRAYQSIPWLAAELPSGDVDVLRDSAAVAAVMPDELAEPSLATSVPLINADDVAATGSDGAGTAVAILDTGVESAHPALAGKVVDEACFSAAGSCRDGLTRDFGAGSGAPCGFNSGDCRHGTHVAGIAAGVAPGAKVLSAQVFSNIGGEALAYTSDIVAGLEWVYLNRATTGVVAANLSLGSGLYTSACTWSPYRSAIDTLRAAGIATVVSSGNDYAIDAISSPACVPSAVSVGSTTKSDTPSGFGNRSPQLSLMAPGSSIVAAVPGGGTASLSGTSMAAPHVTGAWALLRSAAPAATVTDVLAALQSTGVPVGGYPRIDTYASLRSLTVPQSPTAAVATGEVTVSWAAPRQNAGALTGYRVAASGGVAEQTTPAGTTSARFTGLTNGTAYTFTITGVKEAGETLAATVTATPAGLPGVPTAVTAVAGVRSAAVSWTAPDDTGAVALTGYRVTASPAAAGGPVTVDGTTLTATVPGLAAGVEHAFTVEALNVAGTSGASAPSGAVVPAAAAPAAPAGVTASAGDGTATVSWTAPADDGGSPLVDYLVTPSAGAAAVETTATSATFPIANGTTASFSVVARNAVGSSPAAVSAAVTPAAPVIIAEPAPAPAPIGGGGGGGFAPAPTTTTTVKPPTTTTTVPRTVTTTPPAPLPAPPSPGAAVNGGVLAVRNGSPVLLAVPNTTGGQVLAGAVTPSGKGAWVVTADGAVHTTGDAKDLGDLEGVRLNKPLVGMAPTASGRGYWMLASDGGIFTFGDARFLGSTGAIRLNQPITTMAATPTGRGYWLLARDGGVFTFGDAAFHGSTGAMTLNQPVTGMAATPSGRGYWLVAGDGGIFTFGDARFAGAGGNGRRISAMAPTTTGKGYWLLAADGTSIAYGDARR